MTSQSVTRDQIKRSMFFKNSRQNGGFPLPRGRAQRLQCVRERNRQPSTIHALNINKDTYTERKRGTEHIQIVDLRR